MAGIIGESLRDLGAGRGDDLAPFLGVRRHHRQHLRGRAPNTSKPCSPRRLLNPESATAVLTSLASRSTTCCGVLAGASNPNHPLSSYPGTPASCMVGTCGIRLEREGDAIANTLPLPPAASAIAEGGPVNMTSTTPAAMSVIAGAVPR